MVFKQIYSWSYFHVLHQMLWAVPSCKKCRVTSRNSSWVSCESFHCPEGSSGKKLILALLNWFILHYFSAASQGWCCAGTEGGTGGQRSALARNWEEGTDGIRRHARCHQRVGQKHLLRGQIFKVPASLPALLPWATALNTQSSRVPTR